MTRMDQADRKTEKESDLISCKMQLRKRVEEKRDSLENLTDWLTRNCYEIEEFDTETWQLFEQALILCVNRYLVENQEDLRKLTYSFQKELEHFFMQVLLLNPSFALEKAFPFERVKQEWNITKWNYEIILGILMYARMAAEEYKK